MFADHTPDIIWHLVLREVIQDQTLDHLVCKLLELDDVLFAQLATVPQDLDKVLTSSGSLRGEGVASGVSVSESDSSQKIGMAIDLDCRCLSETFV